MKRTYRAYTDQQIIQAAKESKSLAQILDRLGLKKAGGNYANMKKTLQSLNVNCDHWTGQAWSKSERLKDWSEYTKVAYLKKHLIKERGHRCEHCKNEKWFEQPIALEVHHKDGDRTNNELCNLELRCCNCHAMTHNWRNRKIR